MQESDRNEHDDLMKRHRKRRETDFVPWHMRRSEGALKLTDEGARVTLEMEIAGLGTLVIHADAKFSELLQTYQWNAEATMSASLTPVV